MQCPKNHQLKRFYNHHHHHRRCFCCFFVAPFVILYSTCAVQQEYQRERVYAFLMLSVYTSCYSDNLFFNLFFHLSSSFESLSLFFKKKIFLFFVFPLCFTAMKHFFFSQQNIQHHIHCVLACVHTQCTNIQARLRQLYDDQQTKLYGVVIRC